MKVVESGYTFRKKELLSEFTAVVAYDRHLATANKRGKQNKVATFLLW